MIDNARARRIERYCGNATPEELEKLLSIILSFDVVIGNDIYYSIVTGISYESLNNVNCILTSKRNFYRLKFKTLEAFGKYLEEKLAQSDKLI